MYVKRKDEEIMLSAVYVTWGENPYGYSIRVNHMDTSKHEFCQQ